jgi:uncharacterized membrane protein
MTVEVKIAQVLKELVEDLVNARYNKILSQGKNGKLTIDEIQTALAEYGGTLTLPVKDDYTNANIVQVQNSSEYMVEYELWIDHQKSDLTLSCTVIFDESDNTKVSIDGIHVL